MMKFTRKLVVMPLTMGSLVLWLFMLSAWIGHGEKTKTPEEKPFEQKITLPPEAKKEPEKQPPVAEMEKPAETNMAATEAEVPTAPPPVAALRKPAETGAAAASARAPAAQAARLMALRGEFKENGVNFLAGGKGLNDLPAVLGAAESTEMYLAFARAWGFRFVVYGEDSRHYLGELRFAAGEPEIVPVDMQQLKTQFSTKGRLVQHPGIVAMARGAASKYEEDVTVYALSPREFEAYLAGKILKLMKINGFKDVASFEANFTVKRSMPVAIFTKVIFKSGDELAVKDIEL